MSRAPSGPEPPGPRLDEHQRPDQIRARGRREHRRVAAQRLAGQDRARRAQLLDDGGHVRDVGRPGHVRRTTFTRPVPALVESEDAIPLLHPLGGAVPLAGMSRQPVEQDDGRSGTAEVAGDQAYAVGDHGALHPIRHPRVLSPRHLRTRASLHFLVFYF